MSLKNNKYYWEISLKNPEPIVDSYYTFDQIIVSDKTFIKNVDRLRELIISYCVLIEKDAESASKILNDIYKIILSVDKIQYTEFIAFWKVLDMSYSVFKKLPNQRLALERLLKKYCERRRKLYDKLGYSNIIVQSLYDNGSSRKKGTSAITKMKYIVKSTFKSISRPISISDIISNIKDSDSTVYLLPDNGDKELFLQFVKTLGLKFVYSKNNQRKMPDFFLKYRNHILIIEAKHLKEQGGEQNKSVGELIDFIRQDENDQNYITHYVSFMDGVYFNLFIDPNKSDKIKNQFNDIESALKAHKNNFFVNTYGLNMLLQDL